MGNVRLYGATSGYTELAPPAVAPDGVLSLPSGVGTLMTAEGGKVLQVKQVIATRVSTNSSAVFATLAITPSSNTSKILVMVNAFVRTTAASVNNFGRVSVSRPGSTIIDQYTGNYVGSTDFRGTFAATWLDSPSSSSEITYTATLSALATTVYIDQALQNSSTMTLMEISA